VTTSFTRGENPLRADKLNQALSERVDRSGDTMQGMLTLWADPLTTFHAATKQYVDRLATGSGGVYLPLTGGTLSGTLQLPNGTLAAPSLAIGDMDGSGIDRSGDALSIGVKGVLSASFFANSMQSYGQLYMLNNKIVQVGDATAATDALNQRTGDTRYLPVGTTIVSSFNSRSDAITLSSADVIGALTYTPYNATNPAGYQTAAQVTAAVPVASSTLPTMDGVAAVGTGTTWARADHVHPITTVTAPVTVSDTAPTIGNGVLWFDSVGARLYVGYNDGNSMQWVLV
jgi:hypothetical protein